MSSRFLSLLKKINPFSGSSPAKLPILFLHVPKTAGTSFKKSVRKSSRIKSLLTDYGKDNQFTTGWLNQLQHHSKNYQEIGLRLKGVDDAILTGHFHSDRYSKFFYPYQISMFVRDPTERIFSNFFHKDRRDLNDLNLEEYIEKKQLINLQSRILGDLPPEYFGFIGLSDRYNESLELVNDIYGLDLISVLSNVNPDRTTEKYDVSDALRQRVLELNVKDYQLFEKAKKLFETRVKYARNGRKPLYGAYTIEGSKIIGRAYRAYRDGAVPLDISLNNKKIATVVANLRNPIPFDVKQPRQGNIGFEFAFERAITAKDKVSVTSKNSDEPIFYVDSL